MAEIGVVTEVHDTTVHIEMQRHDACAKCGACISFSNNNTMHLTAKNECDAHVGDHVEISLETTCFLSAVGYLYGIPLITFMVALGAGYAFGLTEGITILIALAVLGITWLIIHFQAKKLNQNRYMPKAIRVVKPTEQ